MDKVTATALNDLKHEITTSTVKFIADKSYTEFPAEGPNPMELLLASLAT